MNYDSIRPSSPTDEGELGSIIRDGGIIHCGYGVCPVLGCDILTPHYHAVCPKCGALDMSGKGCRNCKKFWYWYDRWMKLDDMLKRMAAMICIVILFTIANWR